MWKRKALVLIVDELQTIEPPGMRALRALHQGDHGCPILLVGIGLQHTQQVLGNPPDGSAGISRIAEPITLAPLSEDDALKAISGNMLATYPKRPLPRWPKPRRASRSTSTATCAGQSSHRQARCA